MLYGKLFRYLQGLLEGWRSSMFEELKGSRATIVWVIILATCLISGLLTDENGNIRQGVVIVCETIEYYWTRQECCLK